MIKNKRKIVVPVVLAVIVITYIALVIRVNIHANNAVYKEYSSGEAFSYRGCEGRVKRTDIYKIDEFRKKYDVQDYVTGFDLDDEQIRVCVVEVNLCKKQEVITDGEYVDMDTVGIDISNIELITKTYSAAADYMLTEMINEKEKSYAEINVGESTVMKYPFMLTQPGIREKVMDKIEDEDMWILLGDYEGQEYNIKVRVNGKGLKGPDSIQDNTPVKKTEEPEWEDPTRRPVKTEEPVQTQTPNPTQEELLEMDMQSCDLAEMALFDALNDEEVKKYVEENDIKQFRIGKLEDATGNPLSEKVAECIVERQKELFLPEYSEPKSDIGAAGEGVYIFEWKMLDGQLHIMSGTNELGNKNTDIYYKMNADKRGWFKEGVVPTPHEAE